MSKVLFSVQYDLQSEKKADFLKVINELRNLLKADGLESYKVFEVKGKENQIQEQYTFSSIEAYEAFDDNNDERINILIDKINDMTVDRSTKYTTLVELTGE